MTKALCEEDHDLKLRLEGKHMARWTWEGKQQHKSDELVKDN